MKPKVGAPKKEPEIKTIIRKKHISKAEKNIIKEGELALKKELEGTEDKILSDFQYIYKKLGGRKKFLQMVQSDPKLREQFFKTMMALEMKAEDAKLKRQSGVQQRSFYIVAKNLNVDERNPELEGLPAGYDPHFLNKILHPEKADDFAKEELATTFSDQDVEDDDMFAVEEG
jgi:hypothetical protein